MASPDICYGGCFLVARRIDTFCSLASFGNKVAVVNSDVHLLARRDCKAVILGRLGIYRVMRQEQMTFGLYATCSFGTEDLYARVRHTGGVRAMQVAVKRCEVNTIGIEFGLRFYLATVHRQRR